MKKIFGLLLLVSVVVACNGNGESAEVKDDSAAVAVDSTLVVDSTVVVVEVSDDPHCPPRTALT